MSSRRRKRSLNLCFVSYGGGVLGILLPAGADLPLLFAFQNKRSDPAAYCVIVRSVSITSIGCYVRIPEAHSDTCIGVMSLSSQRSDSGPMITLMCVQIPGEIVPEASRCALQVMKPVSPYFGIRRMRYEMNCQQGSDQPSG